MMSSGSRPSQTPSSIASFTTRTASNSTARRCEKPSPKRMTKTPRPDTQNQLPHGIASQVAEYIGTGGRMLSESLAECVGMRNRGTGSPAWPECQGAVGQDHHPAEG